MLSIGPQRLKELQDAVQQRRREFLEQVPEGAPGAVGLFKDPPHGVGLHGFFKDQGLDPEDYPAGTARAEKLFEEAVADPEQQAVCYMAYIPAENEGRLRAGILLATASRMPTSGRMCAYIVYIYVLEEYRRRGVGCALMRALYDKCEHGGAAESGVWASTVAVGEDFRKLCIKHSPLALFFRVCGWPMEYGVDHRRRPRHEQCGGDFIDGGEKPTPMLKHKLPRPHSMQTLDRLRQALAAAEGALEQAEDEYALA